MPEDDDLPRMLSGRYRLEGTLGHGGMGVVYRGVDLMMKRPIAVKLIRGVDGVGLDDEIAGRFMREAKNTARVQHQHIIEVFDLGRTDEGGLYFVMELLEGESLSARLRRQGVVPAHEVVHIGRQICDALYVAHVAGVIHRDLKPANVMLLSRAGDENYVKVLDFGVAKSYSADQQTQLTHTGMLVGTVDYMAPEQIMGKQVDGRTDIYSLGIVLYKMLSGKAPFRDTGVPALIHAHLNTMPKPLIEVAPGVPNELDRVVLRCLAKNPDRRYESMAELGRALADALPSGEGIELPYPPPPQVRAPGVFPPSPDPYFGDDTTTVARQPELPPPHRLPAPSAPNVRNEEEDEVSFDDATVKMDRQLNPKKPAARSGLPMTPRAPPPARTRRQSTPPPRFEDVTGPRAPVAEPRICAMCQTMNASNAIACLACGVSLMPEDQAAVRARVRAVTRTGPPAPMPSSPPGMMPPASGPYDRASRGAPVMNVPGSGPYDPIPRGGSAVTTTGPHLPVPHSGWHQPAPPQPMSMWERFLMWTGLRGR
jgi:serine/threonine-protein kinase